jgi:hypothetical protein
VSKRQKFILTAAVFALLLLFLQIANLSWRYQAIGFLALLTYVFSAWSLKEGLNGLEWLVVPLLPTLFTGGVGLFYFLTPGDWRWRLPVVLLYSFGLYVLLLTENIFSVAAIRTIQLLRSARAVGFLMTLLTAFFLYDTIFSFRLVFWLNFGLVLVVSFLLLLQAVWSLELTERLTSVSLSFCLVLTLIQAEGALLFSFWPVSVAIRSLALTTIIYVSLGLVQHDLDERLFQKTVREYVSVGLVVLLAIVLTTHWSG